MLATTHLEKKQSLMRQSQDDAFTLAYYLLGDDGLATRVVEQAFSGISSVLVHLPNHFHLEILHRVIEAAKPFRLFEEDHNQLNDLPGYLQRLQWDEQQALILVDVLGLDYAQASRVVRVSHQKFTSLVAAGRAGLSNQMAHSG